MSVCTTWCVLCAAAGNDFFGCDECEIYKCHACVEVDLRKCKLLIEVAAPRCCPCGRAMKLSP